MHIIACIEDPAVIRKTLNHLQEQSPPDSEKIPGVLGMQSGLNSVSMAVGVMQKALYSSYTANQLSSTS